MPLKKQCNMNAFNWNVNHKRKSGEPPSDQDIAIAYSVLKKACGIEGKKKMTPSEMIKQNQKNESYRGLIEELNQIPILLNEVKVKDLKKQNPDLEDFIDELINKKIENKYIQWCVIKKKKENVDTKKIIDLISRFNKYSSDELKKAANLGLIDSEKQGDISFWNKKSIKEFEEFLNNIDKSNLNFNALRKTKFNKKYSAKKVYEDDRVVVWFPDDFEESCEIGQGTWCISSSNTDKWWFKHVFIEGKTFVYLIDKLINHKIVKEAFSVLVFEEDELIEVWNYDNNKNIGEKALKDYYGKEYWNEIKNEIESYVNRNSDVQKLNTSLSGADLSGENLSDADLSGENLSSADLTNANLSGADLTDADLSGADLTNANLTDSDLTNADLSYANLTNADLSYAFLRNTDLKNANLTNADLSYANLRNANLRNANLEGADLSDTNLNNANLNNADLENIYLRNANLTDADLTDANLKGADLSNTDLTDANLTDANLTDANLSYADLTNADLSNANLGHSELAKVNLTDANLENANLKYVNLEDADLRGTNLKYVNLEIANLEGANLSNANLEGANLSGADLENVDLKGANLEGVTGLPDEYKK
jgi:uncharacterized protein YjbI with pentapeptide repeats